MSTIEERIIRAREREYVTIDEIMRAVVESQDMALAWYRKEEGSYGTLNNQYLVIGELIAAALEGARREGAEQMRAESAKLARALPLYYGSGDDGADESLAQAIEDLPLPAGPRQASRGYEVGAGTDAARRTEMITREQLELAALAAGYTIGWGEETPCQPHVAYIWNADGKTSRWWCPPARLAVRLDIRPQTGGYRGMHFASAEVGIDDGMRLGSNCASSVQHDGTEPDKLRAWREAVTLCAAAVGDRMRGER